MNVEVRKATNRAPILSLVDREYLKSTANIQRRAWEPIAYLYSECDQALERINGMTIPGCDGPDSCRPAEHPQRSAREHKGTCLEWVRSLAVKKRHQMIAWLDEILLQSQSIDALRSWQMMTGLQNQNPQQRPSGAVMPDFPQPTPPGTQKERRGMFRGRDA